MTVPLIILAICAVAGGWFAAPHLVGGPDYFESFVHPVFASYQRTAVVTQPESLAGAAAEAGGEPAESGVELLHALTGPPVIVAFSDCSSPGGSTFTSPERRKKLAQSMRGLYTLIYNKYYVDEIYAALFVRPLLWISTNVLWHVVDESMIDGTVNGVGAHLARSRRAGARIAIGKRAQLRHVGGDRRGGLHGAAARALGNGGALDRR